MRPASAGRFSLGEGVFTRWLEDARNTYELACNCKPAYSYLRASISNTRSDAAAKWLVSHEGGFRIGSDGVLFGPVGSERTVSGEETQ